MRYTTQQCKHHPDPAGPEGRSLTTHTHGCPPADRTFYIHHSAQSRQMSASVSNIRYSIWFRETPRAPRSPPQKKTLHNHKRMYMYMCVSTRTVTFHVFTQSKAGSATSHILAVKFTTHDTDRHQREKRKNNKKRTIQFFSKTKPETPSTTTR